ncbi:MAG: hypothetical protein CMH56_17600 [Myxococcales bacterium]|nr:hypothetical protein [Myxococcales bacterium]
MESGLLSRVEAQLVRQEWAERVVSPAYDALRPEQRFEVMEKDPYVFLHVTRSFGDDESEKTAEEVSESNAAALSRLLSENIYEKVRSPSLYLYQLRSGDHKQTAIIGDVPLTAVKEGRIIPHERIRPSRSLHLADHLEKIRVQSSPVALGYEDDEHVASILSSIQNNETPILHFQREDLIEQKIWSVADVHASELIEIMRDKSAYVVDGHHRLSAASEMWARNGESGSFGKLFAAFFPLSELKISAFHRRVTDMAGYSLDDLYKEIAARDFALLPITGDQDPLPKASGEFSMYAAGQWTTIKPARIHPSEIDSGLLQRKILSPIFHIDEAGTDNRLQYLPGSVGLNHLVDQTDLDGGAAFALHPVPMAQLLSVADRRMTFPPKSTYFQPKVRSGIFLVHR